MSFPPGRGGWMGRPPPVRPGGPPGGGVPPPAGPPVTVFVGNITERAQDAMIRHLLTTCGAVISWKRVQGATGKLQAFGFCEYANPDAGIRAIRLLHNWEIGDKKLVVKVDAKTKTILDDYRKQRMKEMTGKSPPDAEMDDDLFMDARMKHEDAMAKERIKAILNDHSKEMMNYIPADKRAKEAGRKHLPPGSVKEDGTIVYTGPKESLDDVEIEDGKRDIINREIDKFRETMKLREAEKEEEKKRRSEQEEPAAAPAPPHRRARGSSRSRSRRLSRSPHSVSRSPPPPPRRGGRGYKSRTRSRSRSRERYDREVRRRRSPPDVARSRKSQKEIWKEQDIEDEERERKKAERKARDKESSYQERLRKWESREIRMAKDYEKDRKIESKRLEEIEREGKKLRKFLEDYNDDQHDGQYYKGDKLHRRMMDRDREAQRDNEDRDKEKEEIDELKSQILKEGHPDVNVELQRRLNAQMKDPAVEVVTLSPERDLSPAPPAAPPAPEPVKSEDEAMASPDRDDPPSPEPPAPPVPVPAEPPIDAGGDGIKNFQVKRKKIDVRDVFNQDDDDGDLGTKKRKLPPPSKVNPNDKMNTDERRKHIKTLIDKIPTDKNSLFEYSVDWDMVDSVLMEKRIKPWVNKKIKIYIGEPEPTLTDFICSKVLAGSTPKAVLEDVQMVLDEEAEVFVMKLWRLLIYEIESKKLKASGGGPS